MKKQTTTTTTSNRADIIRQLEALNVQFSTKTGTNRLQAKLEKALAEKAEKEALEAEKETGKGRKTERVEVTREMQEVLEANMPKTHKFKALDNLGMPAMQIAESVPATPAFVYNVLNGVYDRNRVTFILQAHKVEGREIEVGLTYTGQPQSEETLAAVTSEVMGIALQLAGVNTVEELNESKSRVRAEVIDRLKKYKVCNLSFKAI